MATAPTFAATPKRGGNVWLAATTANTDNDGSGTIGTDMLLLATAGSSGAFIDRVRLHPVGLAAATATTATVGRVFISTQASGATTNANTRLWQEAACPAQTTAQTTTATIPIDIPMNIRVAASDSILFSMHHSAAANTAWQVQIIYSDY
jgi:hypothetical protein